MYNIKIGPTGTVSEEYEAKDYYMENGWIHILLVGPRWVHKYVGAGFEVVADYFEIKNTEVKNVATANPRRASKDRPADVSSVR